MRRAGDRAWSRTRPASLTQPSGRPCAERGSRDRRRAVRQAANRYAALPWRPAAAHGRLLLRDRSQRSRNWMRAERRVGSDFAHALVDDRSRLAYVELYPDERAATVTSFVERPTGRPTAKVERFHQTLGREWAKGVAYSAHGQRKQALPTPARALQRTQAAQLARGPTTDQPRSQPP
jgi:hypothetical protein